MRWRRKAAASRAVEDLKLPELERSEKDEKKRGAAWAGGASSDLSLDITVRGSGSILGASRAAGSAGWSIASTLARLAGGPTTALGAFFLSSAGKALVSGGLLLWAALIGAALYSMSGLARPSSAPASPWLGMSDAGPRIDRPSDRALRMVASANRGEVAWDADAKKAEKRPAPEDLIAPDAPKQPETQPVPPADVAGLFAGMKEQAPALADDFTQRLSKEARGGSGGLLAMGVPKDTLKDGLNGFALKSTFAGGAGIGAAKPRGKLAAFGRSRAAPAAKKLATLKGRASRAMGQLKLAHTMSSAGAASEQETQARQYSANAFEQKATPGGQAGIDPSGAVVPPSGTGAPDLTSVTPDEVVPDTPPVITPTNVTPYQGAQDAAKNMSTMAALLKMIGAVMLGVGALLLALGVALMFTPATRIIGVILMAAGAALLAIGAMMLSAAGKMADQAKKQGEQIADQYGQKDQGAIVDDCASQAAQNGTQTDACAPATTTPEADSNGSLREDIAAERNATYTLARPDAGAKTAPPNGQDGPSK